MLPTDEDLVAAVQGGDSAAFDVLVRRWDRKIQGAAYRVLGSDDEARDVSQEAFLKAFRGLRSFKREARFSSWLYQIAMNLCRDRLRRRRGASDDDGDKQGDSGECRRQPRTRLRSHLPSPLFVPAPRDHPRAALSPALW